MRADKRLVRAAASLRKDGHELLLATLVDVAGSSYRRPGARILLTKEHWIAGSISGGCIERDLAARGWWRTRSGAPVLVTYDMAAPDEYDDEADDGWGSRLGCGGVAHVLIERVLPSPAAADPLAVLEASLDRQEQAAIVTVIRSHSVAAPVGARVCVFGSGEPVAHGLLGRSLSRCVDYAREALEVGSGFVREFASDGRRVQVFAEAIVPPVRLFIFGDGHDAGPVAALARNLGWDAALCCPRGIPITTLRARFRELDSFLQGTPEEVATIVDGSVTSAALVMSHHVERDRAALTMLLQSRAQYIGVLGSRARTERLFDAPGLGPELRADPRVHAPVGLDIGGETPEEIALAMIAEIQSVLAGAAAKELRQKPGTIHGPDSSVALVPPSRSRVRGRRLAVPNVVE